MPSPKNSSTLHAKLMSNIREIQARGAVTIVIAEEVEPLLPTIPLQAFAASLAQAQGYDIDKPRNLTKSVTVE
jgi:glucosamine--fructose-6-phosphate aminotransferase (isomerizing)